ncbi:MAG TPA: hypothetical protein PKY11_02915, partial [Kiritimatiellia bacterium]|nr:hypothetical protein [Kiritimatiellia bacterium]
GIGFSVAGLAEAGAKNSPPGFSTPTDQSRRAGSLSAAAVPPAEFGARTDGTAEQEIRKRKKYLAENLFCVYRFSCVCCVACVGCLTLGQVGNV